MADHPLLDRLPRLWAALAVLVLGSVVAVCATGCCGGFSLMTGVSNWWGPRNWTMTPCRVVGFGVIDSQADPNSDTTSSATIDVSYEYEVQGKRFTSTRYAYSTNSADLQLVQAFQKGPAVCFVDPSNPASAVLVRGFNTRAAPVIAPAVITMIFVVGGATKQLLKETPKERQPLEPTAN